MDTSFKIKSKFNFQKKHEERAYTVLQQNISECLCTLGHLEMSINIKEIVF